MSQFREATGDEERHPLNLYRDEAPPSTNKKAKLLIFGIIGIIAVLAIIAAILFALILFEKHKDP